MTVSLTIKTLDSQNHSVSDVDEESTVKELKEKISSKVGITADLQRLIYCGRVLNDEKKIKEYSLDGKVVHLVQRPPPTGGPDRLAASEAQARSRGASPSPRVTRRHIHHIAHAPPSQPSALVRLNLAKRMLTSASTLLDRLETGDGPAPPAGNGQPSSQAQGAEGRSVTLGTVPIVAEIPLGQEMSFSLMGGPGGAPPGLAQAHAQAIHTAISSVLSGVQEMSMSFTMGPDGQFVQQPPREGTRNPTQPSEGSGSQNGTPARRPPIAHPPPSLLAEVMNNYRRVQERLDPHWTRLTNVLTEDPALEGERGQEHQMLFNRVTGIMHYMSHAQHAMSDTVLNLSNPPPRHLRARPFVVPMVSSPVHSVLHAVPRPSRSSSASRANFATSGQPTSGPEPARMDTEDSASSNSGNLVPSVEVVMEPVVVDIEMEASGPGNNIMMQTAFGNFGGLNLNVPPTSTTGSSASASSSSSGPSESSTQDSRARGNTQTQPTTSTRTRLSTQVNAAPMGPPIGFPFGPTNSSSNFDILLPCNSHHIPANIEASRRARQAGGQDRRRSSSVPNSGRAGQVPLIRVPGGRAIVVPPLGNSQFVQRVPRDGGGVVINMIRPQQDGQGVQTSRPSMGLETSLNSLLSGLTQGVENDSGMANVFSGIIRQVFAAMTGGEGEEQSQTIAAFLEGMPDYNYRQGEDLMTDLLMCLARRLTFADLVGILTASNTVMGRLQEPLREFMKERLRLNDDSEVRDIEEALSGLIDDHYENLESSLRVANVNPDVDFPETLVNFLSVRLAGLAVFIWQCSAETFSSEFYDICQKFLHDLTNLSLHCFSDGQASLERLLRNHLSNMDDLGSTSISSWTLSTAMGHLRTYTAGIGEPGDTSAMERYIVRTSDGERRRQARKTRKSEAKEPDENEDAFVTPRSSPEAMEIGSDEDSKLEKKPKPPSIVPVVDEPPQFPRSLLSNGSMGPDMVIGREAWHRQIPSDWVPVVARDVQIQQAGVPEPAPYSDAYLSTQPAKRRKVAEAKKPEGDVKKVIDETLKDALKATGAKPSTSEAAVSSAIRGNDKVQEGVVEQAKASIKSRIQKDKDLVPDRHPNCKSFSRKS